MPKDPVMLEPKPADERKRDDDGDPSRRFEHLLDSGRDVEPGGEEGKAESEDEIAKRLQTGGEFFVRALQDSFAHAARWRHRHSRLKKKVERDSGVVRRTLAPHL